LDSATRTQVSYNTYMVVYRINHVCFKHVLSGKKFSIKYGDHRSLLGRMIDWYKEETIMKCTADCKMSTTRCYRDKRAGDLQQCKKYEHWMCEVIEKLLETATG